MVQKKWIQSYECLILRRGGVHMKKVRRKCIGEFKEGVVELVTEQGYKISEAARNLGIHAIQFGRWAKEKSLSNRCGTG